MSRTIRRGYDRTTGAVHDTKSRADWSCGNPACCGGKEARARRRAARARARAAVRRQELRD
ncbi:hypothetical protein [Ornithinimicrobium murale]|uniref:hypothetical protein n=1 Tax=Ornithinimicrobium murale TaxID=1050153 RepID=UPI0013B3D70E|nr:hypothetical protein [Ornithinimicrobium murale]